MRTDKNVAMPRVIAIWNWDLPAAADQAASGTVAYLSLPIGHAARRLAAWSEVARRLRRQREVWLGWAITWW
jgi:hypothetical protein